MKRFFFLLSVLVSFLFVSCGGGGNSSYVYSGSFLASYVKGLKVCVEGGGCTYTDSSGYFVLDVPFSGARVSFYKDNVLIGTYIPKTSSFVVTPFLLTSNSTVGSALAKIIHGMVGDVNGTSQIVDLSKVRIVNSTSTNLVKTLEENKTVVLDVDFNGTLMSINATSDNVTLCVSGNCSEVNYRDWLVLIYMDGDNSLSSETGADLTELADVVYSPQVKVVVLKDTYGVTGGTIYDYNYTTASFDEIPVSEPDMGNSSTLVNFVESYAVKYPASNIALIMWDHGDGWRSINYDANYRVAAIDETSNDYLFMHELREALQKLESDGIKVNLIGFDECLMGSLEVFYDIKDYTDVIVASEVTEPFDGWNYSYVMEAINNNPSLDAYGFGKAIVDAYKKAYSSGTDTYTMIAVKSSDVDALVKDINEFVDLLNNTTYDCFYSARQSQTTISDSLGAIDLGNFAYELGKCLSNTYVSDIINRINSFYKYVSDSSVSGISIFFPNSDEVAEYDYYFANVTNPVEIAVGDAVDANYYNPFTETTWDDFLKKYFGY
ncbi:hypothetical protein SAMN06265339_0116 [Desulfurobacterium pacificum]|uniref:Clostripain n=1 Tax=Desulfurobacterium pacificum TaxID=240166 RepID=A0ABY1N9I6_9BACT|nr:clostripain-related cysteine peptidase [Desulfurobacterium pacificum]SMP03365.1 hypothetical protein SAMN06265339_0116 [Desulfurobacterium pacificum]